MTLSGQLQGTLKRQYNVLENLEFMVAPEASKILGAKSNTLYIMNNIVSGSSRGETSRKSFPNAMAISSTTLRKGN